MGYDTGMTMNTIEVDLNSDGRIHVYTANSYGGCSVYLTQAQTMDLIQALFRTLLESKILPQDG